MQVNQLQKISLIKNIRTSTRFSCVTCAVFTWFYQLSYKATVGQAIQFYLFQMVFLQNVKVPEQLSEAHGLINSWLKGLIVAIEKHNAGVLSPELALQDTRHSNISLICPEYKRKT